MIITRPKIGDGSDDNPFRPDMEGINCSAWVVVEERETEFDVMVYDYVESENKVTAKRTRKK